MVGGGTSQRLLVPDLLRGFAIIAMLLAHAKPFLGNSPEWFSFVISNISDLASPLFALVMGISAQIVWSRTELRDRPRFFVHEAAKAVVLILLGMWMSTWGSWVAIVLQYLGVTLLIGCVFLALSYETLIIATGMVLVASVPLNTFAQVILLPNATQNEWLATLGNWLFWGPNYRVTNLLPWFLFGAVLMRHGFTRDRWLATMAVVAVVAYPIRPLTERIIGQSAQSGSYPDTLHDVGLVFAVYVVTVWLVATFQSTRRGVLWWLDPVKQLGQIALSVYVLHIALLAFWLQPGFERGDDAPLRALAAVGVPALLAWAWNRWVGTGPVEWLLGAVTGRPKPLIAANAPRER